MAWNKLMRQDIGKDAILALARRQWADFQRTEPGTLFGEPAATRLTMADAYAIQRAVADLRCLGGDAVAGYKIGCTGPEVTKQFGMRGPIRGRLYRSEIHRSGTRIESGRYRNLAVEGEIGVRLDSLGRPAALVPVIELHNFLFRGARKTLVELIANNGLNAGVVVAENALLAPPSAWEEVRSISIQIGDRRIEGGTPWAMPGGPIEGLDWIGSSLASEGEALGPNALVLTGTPLGLYPVHPGDEVRVFVDGQPYVACSVA